MLLRVIIFIVVSVQCLSAQKLKVVAYNVEFAKSTTPKEMTAFLKAEKPDIVCFNEVPVQGWTKKVGEPLGLLFSYEGTIASAHHAEGFKDKTGHYFGKYKSILSKYPLENVREINLKVIGWSPATSVVADVIINKKKKVTVFSLHIPSGRANPEKSNAKYLSEFINKSFDSTVPLIVAGDFNDLSDSKPMQYLYEVGLKNSWEALKIDVSDKTTYPAAKKGYVIDHILCRGLKVKNAGIVKENPKPLSDHSAVWAKFKL